MKERVPAIELRGVKMSYNGKPVLEELSHAFPANSVTCVLGPSGSGKTTFLRSLSRMNDRLEGFRLEGQILFQGRDIYRDGMDVCLLRQKVGMVFQKPCVFPKSIFDNVLFGVKHLYPGRHREFKDLAEKALREVFLWEEVKDRLDRPAPTLSLGQQQRLAIARSLAVEPEVLLMDEPTSALDPHSARAIEDLILALKPWRTLLLVTHNLDQAHRVSEEVIFICGGRICETGPAARFFDNPCQQETLDYLSHEADRSRRSA